MPARIVILATPRYSINFNDLYMFYRRSPHEIVAVLHHRAIEQKRWWKENAFPDESREGVFDPIDFKSTRFISWGTIDEALRGIDGLDFDYLCMGNGTGEDQRRIIRHVGAERCLFSEYGWLPWSSNFYISRKGCGPMSEIADLTAEDLGRQPDDSNAIRALRSKFGGGFGVWGRDYVYVPLQKDTNDFKFTLTDFPNNEAFLDFVHEIVPKGLKVVVKRHPLYKKECDFRKYGRFVDITNRWFLSKAKLYSKMRAMICINSTSALEAILFGGKVFAYGRDLFLNKGIVHFDVRDPAEFSRKLGEPVDARLQNAFVSVLMQRQIERRRCVRNDLDYIRNHYWSTQLQAIGQ